MKKQKKNEEGITLVVFIFIIIILLILAGISIQGLTQTGLFEKANQAKKEIENSQEEENIILGSYENKINGITGSAREENITNEELLDLSKYSLEEIKIFDDRLTNVQGGIRKIGNIVNIYLKAVVNKEMTSSVGSWLLVTNLPEPKNGECILNSMAYKEYLDNVESAGIYIIGSEVRLSIYGSLKKGSTIIIQGNYLKK